MGYREPNWRSQVQVISLAIPHSHVSTRHEFCLQEEGAGFVDESVRPPKVQFSKEIEMN